MSGQFDFRYLSDIPRVFEEQGGQL